MDGHPKTVDIMNNIEIFIWFFFNFKKDKCVVQTWAYVVLIVNRRSNDLKY